MISQLLTSALEGRYGVDREIGAGGMATVYLARDIRHDRSVALKVLKPELGAVLGVERFLSEIRVTANLQHPHILPLFDSGEAAGLLFYVMPYVEGESLRQRLDREKQLPVEEAMRIAIAVAGALDYAHRHDVIHRDLKPVNILLHDGQPVIADFGIALAVSNAGGARITQTGLSLGTPQYMSPEQATGDRVVDGRSDIYSLAAVTYEMLAGEAPHLGNTVQAIIARVLTDRPADVRQRRPSVPEHVALAIDKALEKTPADRFSTAHEFAAALDGRATVSAPASRTTTPSGKPSRPRRIALAREVTAWTLAAAAAGWILVANQGNGVDERAPVVRAVLDLPAGVRIADALTGTTVALSPSADRMAYTTTVPAGFQMYIRRMDELAARPVAEGSTGRNLAFSPDGRWLAFTEGNAVKKVLLEGGQTETVAVATFVTVPYGLTWAGNDTLVLGSFVGLYKVGAAGGTPLQVPHSDSSTDRIGQRWPIAVPGQNAVVYASGSSAVGDGRLAVSRLASGELTVFDVPLSVPLGIVEGQLVYVTNSGLLMAIPFDTRALAPSGDPRQIDEQVIVDATSGAKASLSPSGTLTFLRGRSQTDPVLLSRGQAAGSPLVRERHQYSTPRFSPDGQRVAFGVLGQGGGQIWIYDIPGNTLTRLTAEGSNLRPEWTGDGRRIVFRSERGGRAGIWWQPADGSEPAELLYQPDVDPFEALISTDGNWLVYRSGPGVQHSRDIMAVPLEGERTPIVLASGETTQSMPRLSPDDRWLAYQSNEQNRFEIYVRPFPGPGPRVQVSSEGGTEPIWDRSGRALYYRGPSGEVIRAAVSTSPGFSVGERQTVLTGNYLPDSSHPSYDVSPDGRFLMLQRAGAETQTVIVHNFAQELREKTSPAR